VKNRKDFPKEIAFHDTMKTLILQQKNTGRITIPNYSYVPPSALASLSVYDTSIKGNDTIKSIHYLYNHSSSWVLTEDIDYSFAKAHLANIGYEPIDSDDSRFVCINYHEFLYQIHTDYSRVQLDRYKKELVEQRELRRQKNSTGSSFELQKLIIEEEDELMTPILSEYPLCDMITRVNSIGNIIKSILYGSNPESSISMEGMLMSNSNAMKKDFIIPKPNIIKARRRLEYGTEQSRKEVRGNINRLLAKRISINDPNHLSNRNVSSKEKSKTETVNKKNNKRNLNMSPQSTTLSKISAKSTALSIDTVENQMNSLDNIKENIRVRAEANEKSITILKKNTKVLSSVLSK